MYIRPMYIRPIDIRIMNLLCLNVRWRWQEWRNRPVYQFVELSRVNDRVCRRVIVVELS